MKNVIFWVFIFGFTTNVFGQDTLVSKAVLGPKTVVRIKAFIENRHGDFIYIKSDKIKEKKIKINREGCFTDTLAVVEGYYQFYDGVKYADLYLAANYNLTILVDGSNFEKSLSFTGVGANENNYLATQRAREVNYDFKDMMNLEEADFKFSVDKRVISDLRRLDKGDLNANFAQSETRKLGAMVIKLKDYYAKLHSKETIIKIKDLNYEYPNYGGDKVSISDFLGSFVMIQVWATNSAPSEFESQYLREIIRKYEPKGINFVNIAIDPISDIEKWKSFIDEKSLNGVQLIADLGWKSKIVTDFNITTVPRYILIGKDGKLLQPDVPRPSSPNLRAGLDRLLAQDVEDELNKKDEDNEKDGDDKEEDEYEKGKPSKKKSKKDKD